MGDLDKNLWEAIRAFREMYLNSPGEEKTWRDLLEAPPRDSVYGHDLYIGEERDQFGTFLVLIDCTAHEVKRWRIRGKVE